MITFAWYLLKVIICSGILFGYYYIALRNKAFHRWNRFYLLATIVISLIVPVMKINIFSQKGTVVQMLQTISYGDEVVVEYSRNNNFQLTTENITEGAYLLFSAIFLFIFFLSLYKIIRLKKKYPETKIEDITFLNTDAKGTPFSFFKSIFWNKEIDLHSVPGQQIFNHEIAHIKEKHSYDKIFMNVVLIFFWINPFFWLMKKELNMIHEFIADKEALEDSDINAFAKMILLTVYPGQNFSLTNNFFYSPLKRRLHMLTKNKNPKVNYISRLLVLPLATIVFFAFTLKVKNKSLKVYDGKTITAEKDSIPFGKKGSGIFVDTHDKIIIPYDKLVYTTAPEKNHGNLMEAVIIINGKIEPNSILKTKTIHAGTLTIHSDDERDMIAKYGEKAKNGVFILDDATIKNEKPVFPEGGKPSNESGIVFTKVQVEASFPGGLQAWSRYISRAITDSIANFTKADYGTCVIRFIVNTDGTVSDVIATTMKGTELAKVSIHAIKNGPKWISASQNGHTVAAYRLQPVTLQNPDQKATSINSGSAKINTKNDDGKVYTKVENEASFPGGQNAWIKYISRAIQDSINKFTEADYGTCLLKFIVNTDGKVSDVMATTMKGTKLAKVSINAIKKGPMWIPATQNGHTVACYQLRR